MNNNSPNLSRGALQQMVNGESNIKPVLQVLDVKKIVTGSSGERYRLVLSDGLYYVQGMLSTQISHLVTNNVLKKWTVINLKEFVCNSIGGKKICVVIQCDAVTDLNHGIGSPTNLFKPGNNNANNNQQQNRPPPPSNQQPFHQRHNNNNNNNNSNNYSRNSNSNNNNYGGNNNLSRFNSNNCQIQPVSSLNPYQNTWKIKVRVTKKDTMRHYHNQKGDGKLFGIDLLDADGTEIRAVAFNNAAEKFFPVLQQGKCYLISKGTVRLARKGFSHITNDYSITLNEDAEVVPVDVDQNEIQDQKYKFIDIANIERIEPKQFVDVIGIVIEISNVASIISQRSGGKELKRRTVKICDKTASIDVTLWNDDAVKYDDKQLADHPCIALKGAKVSHFGGRSLSASGLVELHPDRPEATSLITWFKNNGVNPSTIQSLSSGGTGGNQIKADDPRRTIGEIKEMKLGENIIDKKDADYFTVIGTITHISHTPDRTPWYNACPDVNAIDGGKNAKVSDCGDGKWRCEKNGKVYNTYIPRYILRFCCTDFTGNIWMTAFNEAAEKILIKTAKYAEQKLNEGNNVEYEKIFLDATFKKYIFKCKATSDQWEDQSRVRYTVLNVQLADPKQESDILFKKIQQINQLNNGNNNNNNNMSNMNNMNMNNNNYGGNNNNNNFNNNNNNNFNNNNNNNYNNNQY